MSENCCDMRVALLSDIHGNLPALEAVLDDLPPVDSVVCAGDIVGYNPWPAECVNLIAGEGGDNRPFGVIVGGRTAGPGSQMSPARPSLAKRPRHFRTVFSVHSSLRAI